jgi:hypothetical protein
MRENIRFLVFWARLIGLPKWTVLGAKISWSLAPEAAEFALNHPTSLLPEEVEFLRKGRHLGSSALTGDYF